VQGGNVVSFPGRLSLALIVIFLIGGPATAGWQCAIFEAKIWTPDRTGVVYFFSFTTSAFDSEHPVYTWDGERILTVMKEAGPHLATVHRNVQIVAFPSPRTFVATRDDVEVLRAERISRLEKLEGYDTCAGIIPLPQHAIDLLQSEPSAQVWWEFGEYSSEACLSYRPEIDEGELLRMCKESRSEAASEIRASPDMSAAYEKTMAERFDRLLEQGVVAIEISEIP
jgi:hypothetical protein